MKKFLVGLRIGHVYGDEHNWVTSITVNMPDNYQPINDEPDYAASFPELRKAIELKAKSGGKTYSEMERYRADRTKVIGITYLGKVDDEGGVISGMSATGGFNAANLMSGE